MNRNRILGGVCVLAIGAIACGRSTAPVAPTTTNATSAVSEPINTGVTTVFGRAVQRLRPSAESISAQGTGAITAVSGACPAVTITILDTPVTVNSSTVFGTGITCAGLTVGTSVHVTASITFASGAISVVATNVSAGTTTTTTTSSSSSEDLTGTVSTVTGTCPALTIVLASSAGTVVTNSSTAFTPTSGCNSIAAGVTVQAHGTRDSDNKLVASTITVSTETAASTSTDVTGTVAAVTGTCPALTMVLVGSGGAVLTTSSTTFTPTTSCSSIAAGVVVKAQGTRNSSNQLVASTITVITTEAGHGHGHKVQGEGVIGHITGSCPALSMVIQGTHVNTTSSTTFENAACGDLRPGTKVFVTAETQTDGSVTAIVVRVTDVPGNGKGKK